MRFHLNHFFSALILLSFSSLLTATELKLEHVANAGVKITSAGKVVLIDALFGAHKRFNSLNDEDFGELTQNGADIALATHMHSDHFSVKRTSLFLKNNNQSLFIGTPDMLEQLDDKSISSQLASGDLSGFESKAFRHNNIKISAFNFPHMNFGATQAKNFAYIVDINGWKILHVGDGDVNSDVIEGLKLASENIDIALIHDLFPVRKKNYKKLIKQMNVGKVVFIHMTDNKAAPLQKWLEKNLPTASMLVTGHEVITLQRNRVITSG